MGLYDDLICEHPLPGTPLEFLSDFQTKDLECRMDTVTISSDGKLVGYEYFTGEVDFYGCNIVMGTPWGVYTQDGEDIEDVNYLAKFSSGQLRSIEQTHYSRKPALAVKDAPPRGFDQMESELNASDSFLGKRLYVLWGGRRPDQGYYVEVVSETDKQLCCKSDAGEMEVIHRFHIGNVIWKDHEEAAAADAFEKQKREEAKEEYQTKLAARAR
jgi:hypothetical protein